jgi:hypothetical protein
MNVQPAGGAFFDVLDYQMLAAAILEVRTGGKSIEK